MGPKGHKHLIRRCTASESLSITSTAAIVGRVIDAATHAGATTINGPDFAFANPSAGEIAAEKAAITDARSQAERRRRAARRHGHRGAIDQPQPAVRCRGARRSRGAAQAPREHLRHRRPSTRAPKRSTRRSRLCSRSPPSPRHNESLPSDSWLVGLRAEKASGRVRDRLDDQRCRVDLTRRDRDRHAVVATRRGPVSVRNTDSQKRLARTVDHDLGFADRCLVRTGHAPAAGSAEPERECGIGETVGGLTVRVGLDPRRKRIASDGELARLVACRLRW